MASHEPEPLASLSNAAPRVGWRGAAVVLDASEGILESFLPHMPDFYEPTGDHVATARFTVSGDFLTVSLPDGLTVSGLLHAGTMRAAASRIELLVVERLAGITAIHAGVVSFDSHAVVLPGHSMAGKSTLVKALLDAGGTYLSDEFALIGSDGRVSAYPRRMTMRTEQGTQRFGPSRAANVEMPSIPIRLVASLTYSSKGWSVEPMTPAAAVLNLVANSLNTRRDPSGAMVALTSAVSRATCITGSRGEAHEAAQLIRAML